MIQEDLLSSSSPSCPPALPLPKVLLLNRLNDQAAGRGNQGAALRAHLGVESISNNFLVLFHRSRAHLYLKVLSNEVKLFVLLRLL